jgi:hypothetical protein
MYGLYRYIVTWVRGTAGNAGDGARAVSCHARVGGANGDAGERMETRIIAHKNVCPRDDARALRLP